MRGLGHKALQALHALGDDVRKSPAYKLGRIDGFDEGFQRASDMYIRMIRELIGASEKAATAEAAHHAEPD